MSRILAIDVGEKRVGLAITDELKMFSTPYKTVKRETAIAEIGDIIVEENVDHLVLGLPYLPSGGLGSQASDIKEFAAEISAHFSLPLEFENEVLSSKEAENRLKGMKKSYSKEEIDAMAACIILESFLNGR